MPVKMSEDEFEKAVDDALDELPERLMAHVENCLLFIEPEPPAELGPLLGLYEGIPLTERDSHYAGVLPDRIFIYREPILEMCSSWDEAVEQIRVTVLHEMAHHFGISDARLHELGWD